MNSYLNAARSHHFYNTGRFLKDDQSGALYELRADCGPCGAGFHDDSRETTTRLSEDSDDFQQRR